MVREVEMEEQREVLFEADEPDRNVSRPSVGARSTYTAPIRKVKPCCCCIDYRRYKSEVWCIIWAFIMILVIVGGILVIYLGNVWNYDKFYRHDILGQTDDDYTPNSPPPPPPPFNNTGAFITLQPVILSTLNASTVTTINSIFTSDNTVRTTVYLSAAIASQSLASVQANPTPDNMQAAMNNILRSTECVLSVSNGNETAAITSLYVSMFSSIITDADAIAYMNITKLMNTASSIASTNSSAWADSCSSQLQSFQTNRRLMVENIHDRMLTAPSAAPSTPPVQVGYKYACDDTSVTDYFFINGATNDPKSMSTATVFLTGLLPPSAQGTSVKLLPNPTDGMVSALMASFRQAALDASQPTADITYVNVVKFLLVYAADATVAGLSVLNGKSYKNQALNNWAHKIANTTSIDQDYVDNMVTIVKYSFQLGRSVVLIGHGSGNRYVDAVYNGVSSSNQQYIQMLYISTPLSATARNSSDALYINRPDDAVLAATPNALPSNVSPSNVLSTEEPPLHYNLVFSYLNDAYIKNLIKTNLATLASNAVFPSNTATFTLYMQLPAKPAITFAIMEPSGLVVNAAQRYGSFGYFEPSGPNWYFYGCICCGEPAIGTWTVTLTVPFVLGSIPSGTFTITHGTSSTTKTQQLIPGTYSGSIIVSLNPNGDKQYDFQLN